MTDHDPRHSPPSWPESLRVACLANARRQNCHVPDTHISRVVVAVIVRIVPQQRLSIMSAGLGIPVKLLHESLGHVVTVELKTGQLYRGKLAEGDPVFV